MKKILFLFVLTFGLIFLIGGLFLAQKHREPKVLGIITQNNQIDQSSSPEPTKQPISAYRVPILMYHYIRDFNDPNDKIGSNLSVSPKTFEAQLKWLKDNDYQAVNPDYLNKPYALPASLASRRSGQSGGSSKPVILTLDDGYKDAYTSAYPLLKKYEFTATFYIITNSVGKDNYMTWNDIKELKKAGMDIGSHSLTHPDLEKSDDSRVDKEIRESKKILESTIGDTISDFCYPSGKYDARTIEALKKYGYKTAVTVKNGIADQDSNLFELPRIRVTNGTNLNNILD